VCVCVRERDSHIEQERASSSERASAQTMVNHSGLERPLSPSSEDCQHFGDAFRHRKSSNCPMETRIPWRCLHRKRKASTNTYTHTRARARALIHTHTRSLSYTQTHTQTHAHTHAHTHTLAHRHTHTKTEIVHDLSLAGQHLLPESARTGGDFFCHLDRVCTETLSTRTNAPPQRPGRFWRVNSMRPTPRLRKSRCIDCFCGHFRVVGTDSIATLGLSSDLALLWIKQTNQQQQSLDSQWLSCSHR